MGEGVSRSACLCPFCGLGDFAFFTVNNFTCSSIANVFDAHHRYANMITDAGRFRLKNMK